MKTQIKPKKSIGPRLVAALQELSDTLEAGKDPVRAFTSRTYDIAEPPAYNARRVRRLREEFGASQGVFAKLLGVSLPLVQGWEQGKRTPSPMARRLLQALEMNPSHWRGMVTARVGRPR